jgi:DNA-binding transcriptional LysR family regulator
MDVEALRAFVAVARAGGFSAAARAASTTQPNLSRRVQQLESQIGARLVARSARGITLTRAGERFLVHAERALRAIEAGFTEVDELNERPRGTVTIGAIPTVGAYVLPAIVSAFAAAHPDVRVSLREGFPNELEDLLARGELDLAVFNLPVRRGDLAARKLWTEDYILAVAPTHRLAGSKRVDLPDVIGESFVVIPGATATRALEAACEAKGVEPRIAVETDGVESQRRMVARGLGIALLPRLIVESDPSDVLAIEIGKGRIARQVAIVHRGEGYLTAAARAFRTMLIKRSVR